MVQDAVNLLLINYGEKYFTNSKNQKVQNGENENKEIIQNYMKNLIVGIITLVPTGHDTSRILPHKNHSLINNLHRYRNRLSLIGFVKISALCSRVSIGSTVTSPLST